MPDQTLFEPAQLATEKFAPRPYQAGAIEAAVKYYNGSANYHGIEILPTGCHAKGTSILMASGEIKAVENIIPGDELLSPTGEKRVVQRLCRNVGNMYKINPVKGESFIINEDHILVLQSTNEGKQYNCNTTGKELIFISLKDYLNKSKSWKHLYKLVRISNPVTFHKSYQVSTPAYLLGLLLGDGSFSNGVISICTPDKEVKDSIYQYADEFELDIRCETKQNNKASSYYITKRFNKHNRFFENPLMREMRELGLDDKHAEEKFIPDAYKLGNVNTRLQILAGLLDTDGHLSGGYYDFISKSKPLADDIAFISRSLGLAAYTVKCVKGCQNNFKAEYYRVSISGDIDKIPCRVERKKASHRLQKKRVTVTGFSIEASQEDNYYGFELDGDHLYLTADFTIHHNSGKSVVIANIAKELDGKTIVFQPSKEILEQNYAKFISYGFRASIYSASAGQKRIDKVTFATIGSVAKKHYLFKDFKNIIVDECHLVNSKPKTVLNESGDAVQKGGMYYEFIKATENCKVLGLTATPYRLSATLEGAMLKFLTRTRPRIFSEVLYCVQNNVLFDGGYLAPLKYFSFDVIDRKMLQVNSSGTDFTDASIKSYYRKINFPKVTAYWANRILAKRRSLLVFASLIDDAVAAARLIPGAVVLTGQTPKLERERILTNFKSGKIRCVVNVGVLTTGFDYPALEGVLIARSTMSLALYYQIIGRVMRPFTYPDGTKKEGYVVDLGGNINFFGKIETMQVVQNDRGLYSIMNNGKHLTNVTFQKY